MSTTSLRLPNHLATELDRIAVARGATRSEMIREAIEEFCRRRRTGGSPDRVGLVDRLVDYPGSGVGDLAARSEEYLRRAFGARRRSGSR